VLDRPPGLKWNYYEPDVLPAWVAEMDFGLAPSVEQAMITAVERGDTGYPYPAATEAVAEAGSAFWSDRLGWPVQPQRVSHAPDVIEGVRRAITHLTRPGSKVILHTPVYYPFFSMVERAGREASLVPALVDDEGRWSIDIDSVDSAFAAGAGSIVLCNPWNPVGRSLNADEVEAVVAVATSHGGRVIADEVHAALTYPGSRHTAAATVDPETVVTVTAASKAWNIPGLKAAQVVLTNDADLTTWTEYFTPDKMGVGTFGLIASAAAYSEGVGWLAQVLDRLDSKRRILAELVEDLLPEARHRLPEATYLAWIDLSRYGWDRPAEHLLEHARVAVSEGAQFGPGGEGHVRFNFATADEHIIEMIERIAALS
jgi:cysteine-S-conjugate beta-lyase